MHERQQQGPAATKSITRARLPIRGVNDLGAHFLEKYAGTSQRYSQRVLVPEAAHRGWGICTTDISNAFLQGVTYNELVEATGEPFTCREVFTCRATA